jgi:hypothetical protein
MRWMEERLCYQAKKQSSPVRYYDTLFDLNTSYSRTSPFPVTNNDLHNSTSCVAVFHLRPPVTVRS